MVLKACKHKTMNMIHNDKVNLNAVSSNISKCYLVGLGHG